MKKAQCDIPNVIVHLDCYEPRRQQVRQIVAEIKQTYKDISFFQYEFKRKSIVPPELHDVLSSFSEHVQGKIMIILSAQFFEKEGSETCIKQIIYFRQQYKLLLYSCLSEQCIRAHYPTILSLLSDQCSIIPYDEETAEYGMAPMGRMLLTESILQFMRA